MHGLCDIETEYVDKKCCHIRVGTILLRPSIPEFHELLFKNTLVTSF